jgi:iron complex outermembrane receptor protein
MKKYVWATIIVLLTPALATASEGQGKEEGIATMEEVVVTATKTEEKRKDIANSVIIIDEEDINESPADGVGRLLAGEAGIDWRTRGNYGGAAQEIRIRGMDSDETQVLVNGMNINSPSLGRANLCGVPLNNIARIEVVKGSGSLLYGSGAMAGTVNIITKRPERDRVILNAGAGYGSEDTYRITAGHGMFAAGDFGYYFTANRTESDGFRDNSDLVQNDVSLNLVYEKKDRLDVSLYGDYIDREFGVPGIRPPAGAGDYFINGVRFYSAESTSTLNEGKSADGHGVLTIRYEPLEWLNFRVKADYAFIETVNVERFNANYFGDIAGEGRRSTISNELKGIEGNAEVTPFDSATLLCGADYRHHDWDTETIDLDTSGNDKPGATRNDASLNTKGVFAELQYRPIRYAKLLAGIRQEAHSTFGYENIPHYGLVLNPMTQTAIKMNHGKFFKAPTPNDLFWPETAWARGNPNLAPQTGWHTDATIEQDLFDNKLFGFLTYFEWDIEDKITWAFNPAFGKWTPSNLNKGEGKGWEAGLEFSPNYNLHIALSYTFTDAEEETSPGQWRGAQYMARDRYKAKVTWRSDFGTTATAVGRYIGDRNFYRTTGDSVPTDVLESYYIADLKVEQRLHDHWLLSLDATNLFNTGHETYIGSFVNSAGVKEFGAYPGAERSIFFSVTYEY